MPKPSLRTVLLGGNVGLVVIAVIGVAVAATGLLREFADREATARVTLAGASALGIVEHVHDTLRGSARLLGERPNLGALVAERDANALRLMLERFRAADHVSGCAAMQGGAILARAGTGLPWDEIAAAARAPGDAFLIRPKGGGPLVAGASSPLPSVPGATVVSVQVLDSAFAAAVGAQVGLPVLVRERDAALRGGGEEDARLALRSRVLDAEAFATERVDDLGLYLAVQPIRSPRGEVVGLVETALPTEGVEESARSLTHSLVLLALAVGGLAALFSYLLGRRLVEPIEAMTEASARIGRGDLATPIPRAAPGELGVLAESMDEMRRRLLDLTAELRGRQSQAEAILGGIVEGVFAVDRERRVRYVNPQAAVLLGLQPERILGRFCGDVLNPKDDSGGRPCEDRCPILHARFRGSTRVTERLVLEGGGERTVVITSAPPDASGPTGASAESAVQFQVIRDETEVEATRRLRDAVLANISHEFRTPLSAQLASIELLRDRLPELKPEEIRDLVLSLERGALRLTQLIDNLLESVRIESGSDSIRRRPVALDEVVEQAVELTSPLTTLRDQKIEVDLPYPLPAIAGDAPRLVQVFVNLLANANKFAPAGSTIRIGGDVGDDEVMLWVEDAGPGLPAGTGAPHFERFLRSPGEEPEESGMGLGLWIVKSIVERHGGRVEVQGGADVGGATKGTRMGVILPRGTVDEDPGR